jgi:putative tryptophan/tyrosine transport system substrate-binding protein
VVDIGSVSWPHVLGVTMKRRDFLTLIGGAAAAWPHAARAQQPAPLVGYLDQGAGDGRQLVIAGFSRGFGELGFVEGRNIRIDYRSAGRDLDQLPALAADLVQEQIAVIFTAGGSASARAARAATTKIPIVFQTGSDPVAIGLVASLNRPGANLTGVTILTSELAGERFDLMHQLVPGAMTIAYLDAPGGPLDPPESMVRAARALNVQVLPLRVASEADLSAAFLSASMRGAGAIILAPRPLFVANRRTIMTLAIEHRIPVMGYERTFAAEGGLISYGANIPEAARIAGTYVGRILKGERPGELPVQRSDKFEFIVNLKAAKTIGLMIPESFLLRTDDVIE